jgi:hypothetical protein
VRAFDENNFGTVREYYANVYLMDANVTELRRYLQKTSAPHCIGCERPEPLPGDDARRVPRHVGDEPLARIRRATPSSSTCRTTAGSCPTRSTTSPRTATARA